MTENSNTPLVSESYRVFLEEKVAIARKSMRDGEGVEMRVVENIVEKGDDNG